MSCSRVVATAVLLCALCGSITGGLYIKKFLESTTQSLDPPEGTQAFKANNAFETYMPEAAAMTYFNVFVTYNGSPPRGNTTSSQRLVLTVPTLQSFLQAVSDELSRNIDTAPVLGAMGDYYHLAKADMFRIADHLVSTDNRSITAPVTCKAERFSPAAFRFGNALSRIVAAREHILRDLPTLVDAGFENDFTVGVNGLPLFIDSIVATSKKDMELMDAVVIPLALVVIALRLRSLRLMLPAALGFGGSFCASFGAMYPLTAVMDVSSSAPLLMMALNVALSLSYCLFVLGRFAEAVRAGDSATRAVRVAIRTAGVSSTVSFFALALALGALAWFPIAILRTLAIGCAVTVAASWLYNVVCVVALLHVAPRFWADGVSVGPICGHPPSLCSSYCCCCGSDGNNGDSLAEGDDPWLRGSSFRGSSDVPNEGSVSGRYSAYPFKSTSHKQLHGGAVPLFAPVVNDHDMVPPSRFRSAVSVGTSPRRNAALGGNGDAAPILTTAANGSCIDGTLLVRFLRSRVLCAVTLLVLAGLGAACAVEATKIKTSDNYLDYLGRHVSTTADYRHFVSQYGYGFTEPFRILFAVDDSDPSNVTIYDPAFWAAGQEILRRIVDDPVLGPETHLAGPMVIGPTFQSLSDARDLCFWCPDKSLIAFLFSQVSPDLRAMFTIMTAKFDPAGARGWDFYQAVLEKLQAPVEGVPGAPRILVYVKGTGPDALDAVHSIYAEFPALAGVSTGVVFLVVLLALRAPLCAFRCAFIVAVSEAVVFGCVVGVYQRQPGALAWTTWEALESMGSIPFIMPVVAFAVVMGLAVAFDVHAAARFLEWRVTSPVDVAAVWAAVAPEILVAGLISVIAMFGMMLSQVPLMNAMGFAFVLAAAVPSLMCQLVATPASIALCGRGMWWPLAVRDDLEAADDATYNPTTQLLWDS